MPWWSGSRTGDMAAKNREFVSEHHDLELLELARAAPPPQAHAETAGMQDLLVRRACLLLANALLGGGEESFKRHGGKPDGARRRDLIKHLPPDPVRCGRTRRS